MKREISKYRSETNKPYFTDVCCIYLAVQYKWRLQLGNADAILSTGWSDFKLAGVCHQIVVI